MTFADELRAAATQQRADWGSPTWRRLPRRESAIHLALANWLDHTASLIEGNSGSIEGIQSSGMAILTARAINGGGV